MNRKIMNSGTSLIAGWLIIIMMLCQFIPLNRVNRPPGGTTEMRDIPAGVRDILKNRCYDCHSNETRWPKIAYIAPLSWYVVHQVNRARTALNFSENRAVNGKETTTARGAVLEMIRSGKVYDHCVIPGFSRPTLTKRELDLLFAWPSAPDKEPS